MIGGLSKSTSLLALLAATGVVMGGMAVPSAKAADLGGDCCADLEERVAELEATTARKGNRKMSLTISGQVNKQIMYFSGPSTSGTAAGLNGLAGTTSKTYLGLDNRTSSTRFNFAGNAKVTPSVSVGFNILVDVATAGRTDTVTQNNEDDAATGTTGDHALRMRDANWWIEDKVAGRLTVGRMTQSGPVSTIDLGGVQLVANSGWGLIGGGLLIGNSTAGAQTANFNTWTDGAGDYDWRVDGVKYTSPTFGGFIFSATIGETFKEGVNSGFAQQVDGRTYGVDLKYAGEFSGYRIAAGIGYEQGVDEVITPANRDVAQWGGSVAVMHVSSGLFLQGDYFSKNVDVGVTDKTATKWNVQGGIAKNWFGLGITSLYAETGKMSGFLEANCQAATLPSGCGGATFVGAKSEVTMWGLGVVQNLDAAATELYIGYRQFKFDDDAINNAEDLKVLSAGARVKF